MELFADFGDGPRFNTYDTIVIPNGSYGNTLLNVYGRQYRINSPNGVYVKENVVASSLNPLK